MQRTLILWINDFRLVKIFDAVKLDLDDEVYIYLVDTKAPMVENYKLYEVYKVHEKGPAILNELGYWSQDTNSLELSGLDQNARRSDLRVSYEVMNNDE